MKKNLMILLLFGAVFLSAIYFMEKHEEKQHQFFNYNDVITMECEKIDLKLLKYNIDELRYSEEFLYKVDLEKKYKFECIRNFNGKHSTFDEEYSYNYAIIKDNSGGILYLFFENDGKIFASYYFDKLLHKGDFDQIREDGTTTEDAVIRIDPNTYDLGYYGMYSTGHIVAEGIFILEYASKGVSTVTKKTFYETDEDIQMMCYFVPGILDIDKQEMLKSLK